MTRHTASRLAAAVVLCCASLGALHAQGSPTLAVNDFAVHSENPKFAFLGKGFSEVLAYELKKSPAVRLVDRESRNAALAELEFSLAGLSDEGSQLEAGRLLSVRYIVFGEITDMGDTLLVSLRMLDVETGELVWRDQVMEPGGKYSYIGAYFAKSLLGYLKASVDKSTAAAVAASAVRDEAAVVALSDGIAALDSGDKAAAKERLAEARQLDPESGVAAAFLARLSSASAKFKVVPERYVSYYNPAYLGGASADRAYASMSLANVAYGEPNDNVGTSQDYWLVLLEGSPYGVFERQDLLSLGYQYPLTPSLGLGFEYASSYLANGLQREYAEGLWLASANDYYRSNRLTLTAGLAAAPWLSVGAGVSCILSSREWFSEYLPDPPADQASPDNGYYLKRTVDFGGELALAAHAPGSPLSWDILASYGSERLYWFDSVSTVFVAFDAPLYIEQTATLSLADGRLFAAIKQVNDVYFLRDLYYGRAMPSIEWWMADFLALRLGAEGSLVARGGETELGYGATLGLTVRVWKFDFDVNATFRLRPARTLEGLDIPEYVIFATVSSNGLVRD